MFPLYSAYDEGHVDMANNYLTAMMNVLLGYNPNLSEAEAIGLAWEGLESHANELWQSIPPDLREEYVNYQLAARYPDLVWSHNFTPCN